ncbi:MAG: fibronectin type III domain-containing protein, partial [Saprospiraceae bacterium]
MHTKPNVRILKTPALLFALFCCLIAPQVLFGQAWPVMDENTTFDSVQAHFNRYWEGKKPGRGSGWKPFKRWEYYWQYRLMPDGKFPPAGYNMAQFNDFVEKNAGEQTESLLSNWTNLGPNSSNSGYAGIGRVNCIAFHPTNSSIMWAGTPAGGLWRTTNGGTSWSPLTDNMAVLGVTAIAVHPTNPNILYIATGDAFGGHTASIGVMKSENGGTTWTGAGLSFSVNSQKRIAQLIINPANPAILLAATSDGIYRSTNSGANWSLVFNQGFCWDIRFKPGDPNTVHACTGNSVLRSTNGGQSFSVIGSVPGSSRMALAVTPANPDMVVALSSNSNGAFNGLYRSLNGGLGYTLMSSFPNLLNSEPDGSGSDGQGWYDLCVSISPTNANTIFVGGVNLWRSVNGGSSWSLVNFWHNGAPPGVAVVHADKHFLGWRDNNTLFQGCDGGIYRSTNNGTSWTDLSNTMVISQMYRLSVSQADNKVITGLQDNGTKLRGTSGNWTDVIGGDGMDCLIHPTNPNVLYGSFQNGVLHRSLDGGSSWTNIRDNIPGQPTGAWVTPMALASNGTLFAGYTDVWRTTNQGTSWTKISFGLSANNLTSLAVAPSNPDVLYASDDYSIYRTTNGGSSWSVTPFFPPGGTWVAMLAVSPANPSKVYLVLSGYVSGQKVYRSLDGGSTWSNISGSLPNLPANCILEPSNASDALYVGMDVGIYYKAPNSNTWSLYNTGIPNVPIRDLEIRTATNTLRAATFGRGLWESPAATGGNTGCAVPGNLITTNISATSATVSWGIVSGAVNYTVQRRVANGTWSDAPGSPTSAPSMTFSGLSANTAYEWRVRTNCNGTQSAFSAAVSFTTSGGASCGTPGSLSTTSITSTTARFNWGGVNGALNYTVQIRFPNGTWSDLSGGPFSGVFVNVSGLSANTAYEWRVRANCSGGQSAFSAAVSFTTSGGGGCGSPTGLNASNITQVKAFLSWNTVSGATSYIVQFYLNGGWLNLSPVSANSTNVYGLVANASYQWRVIAVCGNVQSAPSVSSFFNTAVVPDCPGGIQYPSFALNPTNAWQYQPSLWGGEYSVMNVQSGQVYTFSMCSQDGGLLFFDGELSIRTINDGLIMYSDDVCGTSPRLVWQAGFTGQVRVLLTAYSCAAQSVNSTLAYRIGGTPLGDDPASEFADGEHRGLDLTASTPALFDVRGQTTEATAPAPAASELRVFPNPATDEAFLEAVFADLATDARADVYVYDAGGSLRLFQRDLPCADGLFRAPLRLTDLPAGVYYIQVVRGCERVYAIWVKQPG